MLIVIYYYLMFLFKLYILVKSRKSYIFLLKV